MLMPTRKTSSPMKRLRQRFLWIVLRSLCRPLKKQKVKRLMARQTRDTAIPILVMTVRRSSWTLPSPYGETDSMKWPSLMNYPLVIMVPFKHIMVIAIFARVQHYDTALTWWKPQYISVFAIKMEISMPFCPQPDCTWWHIALNLNMLGLDMWSMSHMM